MNTVKLAPGVTVQCPSPKPAVIRTESTIFVDCDDTLVMWGDKHRNGNPVAHITSPHNENDISVLAIHQGHVKILKDRKARGSFIVVWRLCLGWSSSKSFRIRGLCRPYYD